MPALLERCANWLAPKAVAVVSWYEAQSALLQIVIAAGLFLLLTVVMPVLVRRWQERGWEDLRRQLEREHPRLKGLRP